MRPVLALVLFGSFAADAALADSTLLHAKPATAMAFLKTLERYAGSIKYDCRTYEDKNLERLIPPILSFDRRYPRV
jgi:hypothetical protein